MTKQEAIQKLEDTEKELAKLRAIIEAQESSQWLSSTRRWKRSEQ